MLCSRRWRFRHEKIRANHLYRKMYFDREAPGGLWAEATGPRFPEHMRANHLYRNMYFDPEVPGGLRAVHALGQHYSGHWRHRHVRFVVLSWRAPVQHRLYEVGRSSPAGAQKSAHVCFCENCRPFRGQFSQSVLALVSVASQPPVCCPVGWPLLQRMAEPPPPRRSGRLQPTEPQARRARADPPPATQVPPTPGACRPGVASTRPRAARAGAVTAPALGAPRLAPRARAFGRADCARSPSPAVAMRAQSRIGRRGASCPGGTRAAPCA